MLFFSRENGILIHLHDDPFLPYGFDLKEDEAVACIPFE